MGYREESMIYSLEALFRKVVFVQVAEILMHMLLKFEEVARYLLQKTLSAKDY